MIENNQILYVVIDVDTYASTISVRVARGVDEGCLVRDYEYALADAGRVLPRARWMQDEIVRRDRERRAAHERHAEQLLRGEL